MREKTASYLAAPVLLFLRGQSKVYVLLRRPLKGLLTFVEEEKIDFYYSNALTVINHIEPMARLVLLHFEEGLKGKISYS